MSILPTPEESPATLFSSERWLATAFGIEIVPLICAILILTTIIVVRRNSWAAFSGRHKWLSRIITAGMLFALIFTTEVTATWLPLWLPGKVSFETPLLTSTAIKFGVYSLLYDEQSKAQLPPDQSDLFDCVTALSRFDGNIVLNMCKDDPACVHPLPPQSREAIMAEIREIQAGKKSDNLGLQGRQACRQVRL